MLDRTILDGIRVASPCPANWDEMVGDDRTRFCSGCKKDVYNISGLSVEEALGLVSTGDGEAPCVRFYRRGDGTVLTSDCPVGSRKVRRRLLRRVAGVGVVGLAMAASGLTALGFSRRNIAPPRPTWAGSTFDDWIDWGLVSIGVRAPRGSVTMGAICAPPIMPPTTSGTLVTPIMGEMDGVLPPMPDSTPGPTLGKPVAPIKVGTDAAPPATIQP